MALVLLGYTAAMYWPALQCGLISDGWALLYEGTGTLGKALATRLGYHFIPVTHLLDWFEWHLFGLHERLYQMANLAALAAVGVLLYIVVERLSSRPWVPLLTALIFLSNSSYYEVPLWTGVGNFQSLAALLYLFGVLSACEAGASGRPARWSALLAVCAAAAFFTYEPTFSLLAVGFVVAVSQQPLAAARDWRARLRRGRGPAMAALVVASIACGVKLFLASAGDRALFLPQNPLELQVRTLYFVRALVAIFTLRADGRFIDRVVHCGIPVDLLQPSGWWILGLWLASFAAIAGLLVWRHAGALRVATLWFVIHMLVISVATIPESRHYYLATLPAAWLSAELLARGARAGSRRLLRMSPVRAEAPVALLILLLALPPAKHDLDAAAAFFAQATTATRAIKYYVRQRLAEQPPLQSVSLVNLPAQLVSGGIEVHFFVNGMREMVELASGRAVPRDSVHIVETDDPDSRPGERANGTSYISLSELDGQVRDLTHLVIAFDAESRTAHRLVASSWGLPDRYTPAAAPFLDWHGLAGYVELPTDRALELPLAFAAAESWIAIRFLRNDQSDLRIAAPGARLDIAPRELPVPYWAAATFNPRAATDRTDLSLSTSKIGRFAGIWAFVPPSDYTPQSAPFLTWMHWDSVFMSIEEALSLPLRAAECAPRCALHLEYRAEAQREADVSIDGGAARALPSAPTSPWVDVTVPLSAPAEGSTYVVRIAPVGPAAVRLRALRLISSAGAGGVIGSGSGG